MPCVSIARHFALIVCSMILLGWVGWKPFGILGEWYHRLCPICRYAVTPIEAACHRWRENHYPESHRPAEVGALYPTLYLLSYQTTHEFILPYSRLILSTFYSKLQELLIALYGSLSVPFRKDHEKVEFEVHEVYAVDVLVSSGEGKVRNVYQS